MEFCGVLSKPLEGAQVCEWGLKKKEKKSIHEWKIKKVTLSSIQSAFAFIDTFNILATRMTLSLTQPAPANTG